MSVQAGQDEWAADPGLAAERTALSWVRSSLSYAVVAGLLARGSLPPHGTVVMLPAALFALAVACLLGRFGSVRYAQPHRRSSGAVGHAIELATGAALLAAVFGVVALLSDLDGR